MLWQDSGMHIKVAILTLLIESTSIPSRTSDWLVALRAVCVAQLESCRDLFRFVFGLNVIA